MKIFLARPRGFCAGVDYAIGIVEEALRLFKEPIYILKEIVHNKLIVQELSDKGAQSVKSIEDVPAGSILIFSAHGVPPEFYAQARQRGLYVMDATCPLVRKVHMEAIRFVKQGYTILYIGHEGHDEAVGVIAEAPNSIILINDKEEAQSVNPPQVEKLAYLTQTTLSVSETDEIIKVLKQRFPQIIDPPKEDICYATTNRQLAIKDLTDHCDLVLVLGSQNSSNSQRLRECAQQEGKKAYLIDNREQINEDWLKNINSVGITAGASAPEKLVQEVVNFLQQKFPGATVQETDLIKENMFFPVPNLQRIIGEQREENLKVSI
ncbi:MAG: 4-hydroxy-3-methylbut-2-enyl diphosphate reductase [Candidatus Caenarcaniphilales bacterium]|nr:4-hydroxy-3-methylbut-2-enyl diphosphate reductase [Candidatus Caenarcaniphilales bacterium]